MHIPDGLLDPITTIVLWIVTIAIMILGYFRMGKMFEKEDSEKMIPYIGVLAAIIFRFNLLITPFQEGLQVI